MQTIPTKVMRTVAFFFGVISFFVKFNVKKIAFYVSDYVRDFGDECDELLDSFRDEMEDDIDRALNEHLSTQKHELMEPPQNDVHVVADDDVDPVQPNTNENKED